MFKILSITLMTQFFCFSALAKLTCATPDKIVGMDKDQAIDWAYKSGPSGGNFGWEWHEGAPEGLVFLAPENAKGNLELLNFYPGLNQDISKFAIETYGDRPIPADYRHHMSGMFQITYSQTRQCRRQVFITDVKEVKADEVLPTWNEDTGEEIVYGEDEKVLAFTGWINVDICSPGAKKLFALGAKLAMAKGEKMDTLEKFFEILKQAEADGIIPPGVKDNLIYSLDTEYYTGVYYQTYPENHPLAGHIAPRFNLRIRAMYFEENTKHSHQCIMNIKPTSAYSGVLDHERHKFSEPIQADANNYLETQMAEHGSAPIAAESNNSEYDDGHEWGRNFFLSHWFEAENAQPIIMVTPAVLNKTFNNE